ncbi:hypothetical protein UlMin_008219 [Ulmus minor]
MLEGPAYLVSRELPSSCEQESKWIYNTFQLIELSSNKRGPTDEEEMMLKKLCKLAADMPAVEGFLVVSESSEVPTDQDNEQHSGGDNYDASSLINGLGRDLSINCLLSLSRSEYGLVASLNRNFRSLFRDGEIYKLRRRLGIVEHWVYFSCTLLEWKAYDPENNRWMHLPRMTSNNCFMCADKESLAVGTELLVFGKEIHTYVVYKYSILTNAWSYGLQMNTPRCLFASASLGAIAIFAGGCNERGKVLSSAELYNSETGTWETLPNMNKVRKLSSGFFMDGKFFVIGGIPASDQMPYTCGEVYDFKTKTWTEIPNMFPGNNGGDAAAVITRASSAPPLVAVVKNTLYAADYEDRMVRRYDKKRNIWFTIGSLPPRAVSVNGWGLAFKACGDRLIVVGGQRSFSGGSTEINAWTPNEGQPQWELLAEKAIGSFVYNCTVMGC